MAEAGGDDNISLPSSPPPTYRSRASTVRTGVEITFPPNEDSDRPPTYRSHISDASDHTRPALPMDNHDQSQSHGALNTDSVHVDMNPNATSSSSTQQRAGTSSLSSQQRAGTSSSSSQHREGAESTESSGENGNLNVRQARLMFERLKSESDTNAPKPRSASGSGQKPNTRTGTGQGPNAKANQGSSPGSSTRPGVNQGSSSRTGLGQRSTAQSNSSQSTRQGDSERLADTQL